MKIKMKISLFALGAALAVDVNAQCVEPKPVEYLPVNVIKEYCFKALITRVEIGNQTDFKVTVEKPESIAKKYSDNGVLGMVKFNTWRHGLVTNAFIETKDGDRREVKFITTTSEIISK